MINRLLLPWSRRPVAVGLGERAKKKYVRSKQAGRSDNSTVEVTVDYGDVPTGLERELGRKPSGEVVQRYEDIVLSQ